MAYHVSKAVFSQLVERALATLPTRFAATLDEVSIEIKDESPAALRREVNGDTDTLLLGLYHGRPLTERSVEDHGRLPDTIAIFQEDVELASANEADLIEQVRITVLHELGHHFGMDEDDLDRLGYR